LCYYTSNAILTHSIRDLVLECSKYKKDFSNLVSQGKVLDSYYIPTRYPDSLVGIETLVYTESEFEEMKDRIFLQEVLATAKEL